MASGDQNSRDTQGAKKKLAFGSELEDEDDRAEEDTGTSQLKDADDSKRILEMPTPEKSDQAGAPSVEKPVAETAGVDIQASARVRKDDAMSPSNVDRMKRQRTISEGSPVQNFIFPGVPASPPKFVSLEEVMKAAKGVSNMVIAHEIAVDKNFKLQKFEPPENSIEKQVRDTMRRAFWDNLAEQLAEKPPVYDQAFVLLNEVKDNLVEITLPHHTKLRQDIAEKFDVDLIKQQAQHGVLNFADYSHFVLSIMARLCAPIRDADVQRLMKETDVVVVFRGVMETLDLMRLDMANFTIRQIRPQIVAQSVEYEKKKFSEFLETQQDGLELTRKWLTSHISEEDCAAKDELSMRNVVSKVISKAYLSLLSWPDDQLLPETVVLDGKRVYDLRDRLTQVSIIGAVLLVSLSSLGPLLTNADSLKQKLKKNICIILDPALSEKETYDLLENVSEQVVKDINDHLTDNDKVPLVASAATALKSQLLETKNPNQRVRQLIASRASEFIGSLLISTTARPVQLPPGLSVLQEELANVCGTLLRLVSHNRAVFGEYYSDIISTHIKGYNQVHQDDSAGTSKSVEEVKS